MSTIEAGGAAAAGVAANAKNARRVASLVNVECPARRIGDVSEWREDLRTVHLFLALRPDADIYFS